MIVIKEDVWRADCVAAIGTDEHLQLQIFPVGGGERAMATYTFETRALLVKAYKAAVKQWRSELGCPE